MPTYKELRLAIAAMTQSEEMENSFFRGLGPGNVQVYLWGSVSEKMVDFTPSITDARKICGFKLSMSAINEGSVTDVSLESEAPYKLAHLSNPSVTNSPKARHDFSLMILPNTSCSRQEIFDIWCELDELRKKLQGEFRIKGEFRRGGEKRPLSGGFFLVVR